MDKSGHDSVRVTIKQVAEAAQVHYSTVSKALRGRGRIPTVTRNRILKIAGEIGYRQDSVMQALAAQRSRCSGLHRETRIVFLSNRWPSGDPGSDTCMRQYAEGVQHQVELMGCACDQLPVGDGRLDFAEIQSRLDPARTDGIIIGAFDPLLPQPELEWSRYAVVKIDSAFMLPDATLVGNDRLQIARTAFHHACRLGYRRIGMAVGQAEEESTERRYSAGYYLAREELGLPEIPVLYCQEHREDGAVTARRMADWVREHRPQIVLSSRGSVRELLGAGGLQVPGDIACVHLCLNLNSPVETSAPRSGERQPLDRLGALRLSNGQAGSASTAGFRLNSPDPALAGVIQHHFVVGQKAAEALALLIMRRKRGLAMPSAATYVAGIWQDGASAPPCDPRES